MHTNIVHRLPRWRHRPERVHWTVVAVLAAVAGFIVLSAEQRSSDAVSAWGDSVLVVRATRGLDAGELPSGDAIETVEVPSALVPDAALRARSEVTQLVRPVAAGALLTRLDVSVQERIPAGTRAIGIAVAAHQPIPAAGTRLELVVNPVMDPYGGATASPRTVDATVLWADEVSWLVAVAEADALVVATATISGTVVPLLTDG